MEPFISHNGIVAPLDRSNIDTDQLIPKQFLKRVERTGFGRFLFHDWRFTPAGDAEPEFVLNMPRYHAATVLVTGSNFGCGSSREHAPWALLDYGFRAIIAVSFADIFENNCIKNGMLPVVLLEREVAEITRRAYELADYRITIDLRNREVSDGIGFSASFGMDDFRRHCLLEGLDEIGLTLQYAPKIEAYENRRATWQNVSVGPNATGSRD